MKDQTSGTKGESKETCTCAQGSHGTRNARPVSVSIALCDVSHFILRLNFSKYT